MRKGMVSVVIPNYNYALLLGETIESVIAQTYKNWELIVVDDNSTDNSMDVVREYIEKYPHLDIRLYHNPHGPSGTPTPINIGIKNMKGEYFAWLSSDDVFMPDKLEEQVKLMETAGASLGLVHTSYFYIDDDSFVYGEHFVKDYSQAEFFLNIFRRNLINGNTILVRKSVFDKVGLYMETHPEFPSIWYVSEYLKYLEIAMHYEVTGMRKKLHKTRIHKGNKTFAQTSLGKEMSRISRKFFLKEYPVPKILAQLEIPADERTEFLLRLWETVIRDSIESSFLSHNLMEKNGDFLAELDNLEYIKLGIKANTQLVLNRKITLAEKQNLAINGMVNNRNKDIVMELKSREFLEILNEGKRLFREGELELAKEILELVTGDDYVPGNLEISGLYYLASVQKKIGNSRELRKVLRTLLELEPYHVAGRKMLEELDTQEGV